MSTAPPSSPDWDRLFELAASQAGHFTTQQAAGVGYSAQLLVHHAVVGRLRRVRRGVYRLVHFPLTEHEDLAALWLWSEQAGGSRIRPRSRYRRRSSNVRSPRRSWRGSSPNAIRHRWKAAANWAWTRGSIRNCRRPQNAGSANRSDCACPRRGPHEWRPVQRNAV